MSTITSPLLVSIIILAIAGFITTQPASSSEHKHENHHSKQTNMKLNNGEKWPIDFSLHKGMNAIKESIEANISPIHYKKFTDKQYTALSGKIKAHLAYLFENCKLPTAADAQLHILLFKVMQGSEQMHMGDNSP